MLSVSNATMSSREYLTCCNEAKESAESGKQPDEIAMEELSAESTGAITNAVEQVYPPNHLSFATAITNAVLSTASVNLLFEYK